MLIGEGDVALYNDYGDIFHNTDLIYFKDLLSSDKIFLNKNFRYRNLQRNNKHDWQQAIHNKF